MQSNPQISKIDTSHSDQSRRTTTSTRRVIFSSDRNSKAPRPQSPSVIHDLSKLSELQVLLSQLENGGKDPEKFIQNFLKPRYRQLQLTDADWRNILKDIDPRRNRRKSTATNDTSISHLENLDALALLSLYDETENKTVSKGETEVNAKQQLELSRDLRKQHLDSRAAIELYSRLNEVGRSFYFKQNRPQMIKRLRPLEQSPKKVLDRVTSKPEVSVLPSKKVSKIDSYRSLYSAPTISSPKKASSALGSSSGTRVRVKHNSQYSLGSRPGPPSRLPHRPHQRHHAPNISKSKVYSKIQNSKKTRFDSIHQDVQKNQQNDNLARDIFLRKPPSVKKMLRSDLNSFGLVTLFGDSLIGSSRVKQQLEHHSLNKISPKSSVFKHLKPEVTSAYAKTKLGHSDILIERRRKGKLIEKQKIEEQSLDNPIKVKVLPLVPRPPPPRPPPMRSIPVKIHLNKQSIHQKKNQIRQLRQWRMDQTRQREVGRLGPGQDLNQLILETKRYEEEEIHAIQQTSDDLRRNLRCIPSKHRIIKAYIKKATSEFPLEFLREKGLLSTQAAKGVEIFQLHIEKCGIRLLEIAWSKWLDRVKQAQAKERRQAAILIQCIFRSFCARCIYQHLKREKCEAAETMLMSREEIFMREWMHLEACAYKLMAAWRANIARRLLSNLRRDRNAAMKIQKNFRVTKNMRMVKKLMRKHRREDAAARKIQGFLEIIRGRIRVTMMRDLARRAVIEAKLAWTRSAEAKRQKRFEMTGAAIVLKRAWHKRNEGTFMLPLYCTNIQRRWRGKLGRRIARAARNVLEEQKRAIEVALEAERMGGVYSDAVQVLQRVLRGGMARLYVRRIREEVVNAIERRRIAKLKLIDLTPKQKLKRRAAELRRAARRKIFKNPKEVRAAKKIQALWRWIYVMRKIRRERRARLRRSNLTRHFMIVKVQRQFKMYLRAARKKKRILDNAATKLQRAFRGKKDRNAFVQILLTIRCAKIVQRWWRRVTSYQRMDKMRQAIRIRRLAVLRLQAMFRRMLATRKMWKLRVYGRKKDELKEKGICGCRRSRYFARDKVLLNAANGLFKDSGAPQAIFKKWMKNGSGSSTDNALTLGDMRKLMVATTKLTHETKKEKRLRDEADLKRRKERAEKARAKEEAEAVAAEALLAKEEAKLKKAEASDDFLLIAKLRASVKHCREVAEKERREADEAIEEMRLAKCAKVQETSGRSSPDQKLTEDGSSNPDNRDTEDRASTAERALAAEAAKERKKKRKQLKEVLSTTIIDIVFSSSLPHGQKSLPFSNFHVFLRALGKKRYTEKKHQILRLHSDSDALLLRVLWALLESKWARPIALAHEKLVDKFVHDTANRLQRWHRNMLSLLKVRRYQVLTDIEISKKALNEAATKLQGLWKRRQARSQMMDLARSAIQKYIDPNSSMPFWYNTITGVTTWKKPKLLGKQDVPAVALADPEREMRVMCLQCQTFIAVLQCHETGEYLCASCFDNNYRKMNLGYTFGKIRLCVECEMEIATRTCDKCEDEFCDMCYPRLHRRGAMLRHTYTPLPGIGMCTTCAAFGGRVSLETPTGTELQCWGCYHQYYEGSAYQEVSVNPAVSEPTPEEIEVLFPTPDNDEIAEQEAIAMAKSKADAVAKAIEKANELPLPKEWQEHKDNDGSSFYYNTETGESVWERPKASIKDIMGGKKTPEHKMADDMDLDEAATFMQNMWRNKKARALVRVIIAGMWEKVWDDDSQAYYYYNFASGNSLWTKPLLLGESYDLEVTPRSLAKSLKLGVKITPRPIIQKDGTFVSKEKQAIRHANILQQIKEENERNAKEEIEKKKNEDIKQLKQREEELNEMKEITEFSESADNMENDEWSECADAEGNIYYYNNETGESSWDKPKKKLKSLIKMSQFMKSQSNNAEPSIEMNEAAIKIQNLYRSRKARALFRVLLSNVWEKTLDDASGTFYYFNKKTMNSQWTKPSILKGSQDIDVTPRTLSRSIELGITVPPKEIDSSATQKPSHTWEKVIDEDSQAFYYFNTATYESSWVLPEEFGGIDIPITPRTEARSVELGIIMN